MNCSLSAKYASNAGYYDALCPVLDEVLQLTKSLGMDLSAQGLRVAMAAMDVDGSGEVVRRLIFFKN